MILSATQRRTLLSEAFSLVASAEVEGGLLASPAKGSRFNATFSRDEMYTTKSLRGAVGLSYKSTLVGSGAILTEEQIETTRRLSEKVLRGTVLKQGQKVDTRAAKIDPLHPDLGERSLSWEEPGKIYHEDWDEVTGWLREQCLRYPGERPTRLEGGSLKMINWYARDVTPMFIWSVLDHADLLRLLGYQEQAQQWLEEMAVTVIKAYSWLRNYGDRDDDGLVESGGHYWKDGADRLLPTGGELRIPKPPVSFLVVQGWAYAAMTALAKEASALGLRSQEIEAYAGRVKQATKVFAIPDITYYGFAIDGAGELLTGATSDPAHILWTGVLDQPEWVRNTVRVAMTDWGLPTAFHHPQDGKNLWVSMNSYQKGMHWPMDIGEAAFGLLRHGWIDEALALSRRSIEAVSVFRERDKRRGAETRGFRELYGVLSKHLAAGRRLKRDMLYEYHPTEHRQDQTWTAAAVVEGLVLIKLAKRVNREHLSGFLAVS